MFPASMTIRTGRRSFAISLNSPIDAEAELQIRLHQTDNRLLRAIEEALSRIRQGTYGIFGVCNRPISRSRLEAVPWTYHCRDCTARNLRREYSHRRLGVVRAREPDVPPEEVLLRRAALKQWGHETSAGEGCR